MLIEGQEDGEPMTMRRKTETRRFPPWSALAVVAVALLLGGCDKCGDWFGISKSQAAAGLESCRDTAPQQH
jgi:hypothetical protein